MNGRYIWLQIALHWIIVALIPIQYLTGGSIERTHHAAHMGVQPDAWDLFLHHLHNYAGMSIGLIMGIRLAVRLFSGFAPQAPQTRMDHAARLLHLAFYAVVIAQASLGFIASYLTFSVAPLHVIGSWIILAMVACHLVAAAWHAAILRDDRLERIIRPAAKGARE